MKTQTRKGLPWIAFALSLIILLLAIEVNGQATLYKNAMIIDGVSDVIRKKSILTENGKIFRIMDGEIASPASARVIDLEGRYLMPGLIDAHVHISNHESARTALHSGVTTVRSMGTSHYTDVGMRELARESVIESPEILAAGYHVRPDPDEGFFQDHPELGQMMLGGIHGEEAIREMVRAIAGRKVDWIKSNATARAGLPHTDPREPYYDEAEMTALVDQAKIEGIPVAAHAHGDEGGRAAVLAGVKSIEHGTYLSEETLRLMVEKGTFLVPTIAVVSDLTQPGGDYEQPLLEIRGRHMLPRVRETAAMALKLGVKIIAATDTGYRPNSTLRLGQELEELVGIGMTNLQAIQSATSRAAEFLGVDDHTGRIAEGLDADFLILERNPLENIGAIHDPLMIVNNGRIIVNRIEWIKP